MKIVCTVFWISFFYGVAYGQDSVNNFQVLQEEIVWQKVFQTKLSFEALAERVKDSGLLDKIELVLLCIEAASSSSDSFRGNADVNSSSNMLMAVTGSGRNIDLGLFDSKISILFLKCE